MLIGSEIGVSDSGWNLNICWDSNCPGINIPNHNIVRYSVFAIQFVDIYM